MSNFSNFRTNTNPNSQQMLIHGADLELCDEEDWAAMCRPSLALERTAPRVLDPLYWLLHCIITGVVRTVLGFSQGRGCNQEQL